MACIDKMSLMNINKHDYFLLHHLRPCTTGPAKGTLLCLFLVRPQAHE